jgi:hypothetical protein
MCKMSKRIQLNDASNNECNERNKNDNTNSNNYNSNGVIVLCEYEIIRAKNIERNNARLVELGLLSVQEANESNASAWKKKQKQRRQPITLQTTTKTTVETEDTTIPTSNYTETATTDIDGINNNTNKKQKKKRPLHEAPINNNIQIGSRKSLRLQGIAIPLENENNNIEGNDFERQNNNTLLLKNQREQRRKECHEVRQRIALEYATNSSNNNTNNSNPTATYEHCLYRIRTMSYKALENRIRIIERAAGKHSIIKMAITASCLKDAELWDLATLATLALERLKALQPPPPPL